MATSRRSKKKAPKKTAKRKAARPKRTNAKAKAVIPLVDGPMMVGPFVSAAMEKRGFGQDVNAVALTFASTTPQRSEASDLVRRGIRLISDTYNAITEAAEANGTVFGNDLASVASVTMKSSGDDGGKVIGATSFDERETRCLANMLAGYSTARARVGKPHDVIDGMLAKLPVEPDKPAQIFFDGEPNAVIEAIRADLDNGALDDTEVLGRIRSRVGDNDAGAFDEAREALHSVVNDPNTPTEIFNVLVRVQSLLGWPTRVKLGEGSVSVTENNDGSFTAKASGGADVRDAFANNPGARPMPHPGTQHDGEHVHSDEHDAPDAPFTIPRC
jgi:hypothetical protein